MEKKDKEEFVKIVVKIPKNKKEMIYNVVAKSSYTNASELIRAGIDKELNLQIYKDNMEVILQQIDKCIEYKLAGFINSQRKLYANNVRISALNTYIMGEVMKRIMGDELHKEYVEILKSAREKANYFVSRKVEDISKEELMDFYNLGGIYRNE
ncbi:MAG: hypothetical protein J6A89_00475 [Clostridia bacterium]|nr:hypothetical protein [Clostridia bacterium]